MSATLVSSNTTIKMNAAVSGSGTANGSTVTVYTAPAGTFSILNVYIGHQGSGSVTVGGQTIAAMPGSTGNFNLQGVYVGPSQVVQVSSNTLGLVNSCSVSGVNFTNTP